MTVDQEDDSILLNYAEAEGSGRVVCCGAGVSCWHSATVLCDASIRSLLEAQQTFGEAVGFVSPTRLTQLGHPAINVAAMHRLESGVNIQASMRH
jgi:hypothetical protein